MKVRKWSTLRDATLTPTQKERVNKRVEKEILDLNLRAARELLGKTQVQLAKKARMSQADLSKAERRSDHLLSTLRRYVEALGGELDVIARFGDKQIRIRGV